MEGLRSLGSGCEMRGVCLARRFPNDTIGSSRGFLRPEISAFEYQRWNSIKRAESGVADPRWLLE